MKVQSAELKTRLGYYLRTVEQNGACLEVCVRDRTVAYLIPSINAALPPSEYLKDGALLSFALEQSGLNVQRATNTAGALEMAEPVLAGDGREDLITVETMKQSRDW